jgi:hypothetical protein
LCTVLPNKSYLHKENVYVDCLNLKLYMWWSYEHSLHFKKVSNYKTIKVRSSTSLSCLHYYCGYDRVLKLYILMNHVWKHCPWVQRPSHIHFKPPPPPLCSSSIYRVDPDT